MEVVHVLIGTLDLDNAFCKVRCVLLNGLCLQLKGSVSDLFIWLFELHLHNQSRESTENVLTARFTEMSILPL